VNLQAIKNLQRKHWLMIVGGITAVVTAGLLYGLAGSLQRLGDDPGVPAILRRAGDGQSLFAQIAARNESIAQQNLVFAKLEERQLVLDGMKSDIEAARKRLPTDAQKAEVRQLIEDLARQVGTSSGALTVRSVAIREAAPSTGRKAAAAAYKTVEYQTSVLADMDGIIQFINLIERNERFMTVEGIQLASGGVAPSTNGGKIETKPHSVQLRIVTYIDATGSQLGRNK
jgi:hypothetical protein